MRLPILPPHPVFEPHNLYTLNSFEIGSLNLLSKGLSSLCSSTTCCCTAMICCCCFSVLCSNGDCGGANATPVLWHFWQTKYRCLMQQGLLNLPQQVEATGCWPPSLPLSEAKADRNHSGKIPPLLPTGIWPNHIKFMSSSTLAPMWTSPINVSAELTHWSLPLVNS